MSANDKIRQFKAELRALGQDMPTAAEVVELRELEAAVLAYNDARAGSIADERAVDNLELHVRRARARRTERAAGVR